MATCPMLFALFLLVLGVLAKNPEEPSAEKPVQSPAVKDGTAAGRYEGNGYGEGGGREHGYGGGEGSAEYEVAYGHSQRLVDDYICDMDASILVVTNSEKRQAQDYGGGSNNNYGGQGEEDYAKPDYAAEPSSAGKRGKRGAGGYGPAEESGEYGGGGGKQAGYGQQQRSNYGYGDKTYVVAKAHRLRCSAIAVNSDEDCRKCCHMAARKERSISKESIVGFIVDYDEMRQPGNGYQPGPYRLKREAAAVYPPAAKPDDYQYGEMKPSNNEVDYGSQQPQPQPAYGAEGGKENYESPSNAYGSKPTPSYGNSHSSYNYRYPQKPKNPRCVCCAPKSPGQPDAQGSYGQSKKGGGGYGENMNSNDNNNNNYGDGYGRQENGQQQQGSEEEYGGEQQPQHGGGGGYGGPERPKNGGGYGGAGAEGGYGRRQKQRESGGYGKAHGKKRGGRGPY